MKKIIKENVKITDAYEMPNAYIIDKDGLCFVFACVGIISSCKYQKAEDYLNPLWHNKFVLSIQYDYRSGDDLNSFKWVKNTGTYGETFFCDTLEDAIKKHEDFINRTFENYRTFHGDKIEQINKATIKQVAKSQSLHHYSMFPNLLERNDIYLQIIKNSGEMTELNKYIDRYNNNRVADEKYLNKVKNRFLSDFGQPLELFIHNWHFYITGFMNKFNFKNVDDLNKKQQVTIRKVIHLYN